MGQLYHFILSYETIALAEEPPEKAKAETRQVKVKMKVEEVKSKSQVQVEQWI